jgi:Mrp family chromosome partitioning ATPase
MVKNMNQENKKVEVTQEDLKKMKQDPRQEALQKEMDAIRQTLSGIKRTIIVCSGKGGVGKTTVAANLAIALATHGLNVGILDVDITGPNVPKMLGVEEQHPQIVPGSNKFIPINGPLNVKIMSMAFLLETPDTPVIWRGPMKMKAIRQFITDGKWGSLDYLIADLPPGTSDETLDLMQLTEGSVVVVTTPQDVANLDARKTVMMAKQMKRPILGIIENMAGLHIKCPHCDKPIEVDLFGKGGGQKTASDLDVPFLGAIPIDQQIMSGGDSGIPFINQDPDSPSAKAFDEIVKNIRKTMEN